MASEKELSELRAVIRQRAGEEVARLEKEFEEKGLGFISPPPKTKTKTSIGGEKYKGGRGGEWDFYSNLSKAEKNRIRRNWTSVGGMSPDQFGIDDSITGQFRSVDEGIEEFLDLTRRIDVLKRYSNTGKLPTNMEAYGGLDLDSIFSGAVSEIEMDMRVPVSISKLYKENSLDYLTQLHSESAAEYGESIIETVADSLPPKYDDGYFDNLIDTGEDLIQNITDDGSEILTGAFEDLAKTRPTSTTNAIAIISSSKKPAITAAENFGSKSLKLGALAAGLGLGAGYVSSRKQRTTNNIINDMETAMGVVNYKK